MTIMSVMGAKDVVRRYIAGHTVPAIRFFAAVEVLAQHYGTRNLRFPRRR